MTGLFRRLARQVVGPQPTKVHAMAKLPFVSPPEPQAPVEADSMGSANVPSMAPSPASEQTTLRIQVDTPVPAARSSKTAPAPTHAAPPEAATHATTAQEPTAPESLRGETRAHDPAVENREPADKLEHVVPIPFDGAAPATSPSAQAAMGNQQRTDAPQDTAVIATATADDPGVNIPPPLVSSPNAAAQTPNATAGEPIRPSARGSREAQLGNAPTPTSEPTEVHVHIGRIEVTAVAEATPARSKPRTGKAPMSLDEYLAQRERGRT